jgi:hypothetical protein
VQARDILCAHEPAVLTDVAPARGTHRGRATPRDEPGETADTLEGSVMRDGSWRDMGGVAGIEGVAEGWRQKQGGWLRVTAKPT